METTESLLAPLEPEHFSNPLHVECRLEHLRRFPGEATVGEIVSVAHYALRLRRERDEIAERAMATKAEVVRLREALADIVATPLSPGGTRDHLRFVHSKSGVCDCDMFVNRKAVLRARALLETSHAK